MSYSEADTKAKLITPQLKKSGWTEFHITREHGFKYRLSFFRNSIVVNF